MRVITRQNIWHHGEVYPAGSSVDLSDELAEQLISDGLVESAEMVKPVEPQECEPVGEIEPPKRQARKRKR